MVTGVVLVTAQISALTPIPVRVHFITEQNQKLDGDTTKDYSRLCVEAVPFKV